jgi:hypothetical protein
MTSDDFTPGPWADGSDHVYAPSVTSADAARDMSVGYKGYLVAESCRNKRDMTLIAAAPDMLAALEAVVADGYEALAQVEAAIAKARGL